MKKTAKNRGTQAPVYVFLTFLALVTIFPFVYILLIAFGKNIVGTQALFPKEFTLEHFRRLFTETHFWDWIGNSLMVSSVTMLATVVLVSVSVYVFSRLRFRGKEKLFRFVLLIQVFPLMLSMVSIFRLFVALGLLNDLKGLILVYSAISSAGLVLMAKGFFDTIPFELDEAAMVDGASRFQILRYVILPLARPMLAVVAVQSFLIAYNEYGIASTVMTSGIDTMPLAVGLQSMTVNQYGTNWSLYCAAAVLGAVPMLILYYAMQRHFLGGLSEGAVKM
jgi:arabinogalactan oligomer/maltooligosaccharide transport system permease protein